MIRVGQILSKVVFLLACWGPCSVALRPLLGLQQYTKAIGIFVRKIFVCPFCRLFFYMAEKMVNVLHYHCIYLFFEMVYGL